MNSIRRIEIKDEDVYLDCTIFGISNKNYKNDVLSATYREGGQPALDKAIISMLLDDLYHIELSGDDPSILPYRKAIENAEEQHLLDSSQSNVALSYTEKDAELDPCSKVNIKLKKYVDSRNEQIQERLNAVAALVVR